MKLSDIDTTKGVGKALYEQKPELFQKEETKEVVHKYNAKKVEYDGIVFDSKRECYMYKLLKKITFNENVRISRQVEIELVKGFEKHESYYIPGIKEDCNPLRTFKKKYRPVKVVPDFVLELKHENHLYVEGGFNFIPNTEWIKLMVIDTKGFQTEKSKLQMKMLRSQINCPLLLPKTNKECECIFEMLSKGIFANIKFPPLKKKKK